MLALEEMRIIIHPRESRDFLVFPCPGHRLMSSPVNGWYPLVIDGSLHTVIDCLCRSFDPLPDSDRVSPRSKEECVVCVYLVMDCFITTDRVQTYWLLFWMNALA
ncbi:hypothetical protein TNCV_83021 [Trichonephila clavipes]|nr:hypothetical protein TNCV_83021 [Trichonephila clavipes]